jgi:hypothetical protein
MNAAQCALAVAVSAFGMLRVTGAWVYPGTLTLAAMQTLRQAAQDGEVPVRSFDGKGVALTRGV